LFRLKKGHEILLHIVHNDSGAQPNSRPIGTVGLLHGGQADEA